MLALLVMSRGREASAIFTATSSGMMVVVVVSSMELMMLSLSVEALRAARKPRWPTEVPRLCCALLERS